MLTPLEQRVCNGIRDLQMLPAGARVGVAVSGGADSVALLRLLENLKADLGITLAVVHFDHSLRGAESTADAEFVAELARASSLECVPGREDVAAAAARNRWNLEDAARRMRYAFFERVVAEGRATHIAVAHTSDDQAETVLSHLIRGTGPAGLAGIFPAIGSVVRPLLGVRRQELREYLRERGQAWREDSSNADTRRLRARIRSQLLPILDQEYSPAIVTHLSELARMAREQEVFWTALVEDRFRCHARAASGEVGIDISRLLSPLEGILAAPSGASLPGAWPDRAITERLVRRLYRQVRGDCRELGSRHVEQVIHLAAASSSGRRLTLPGGITIERNFNELVFRAPERLIKSGTNSQASHARAGFHYVVCLPPLGETSVSVTELGTRFDLKLIDWSLKARDTEREAQALDAGLLRAPLVLRSWRAGDAYRPRGHRQPRKLKQMLLTGRIPSGARAAWPVLESAGQVIWARGLPLAEDYCAREGTRTGLLIEEHRLRGDDEGCL
ncbi:MAG: tRNA lysidine(34) synthetase TilS [Candidatus Acidiferrales bacterium]